MDDPRGNFEGIGSNPLNPEDMYKNMNKRSGTNEEKRLEIIKEMNGFRDKDMQNTDKIEVIELVLEDLQSMNVIYRFKNIKSLTLINVDIDTIEGLDDCCFLQELWLNENSIRKIDGLQNCTNLRALYLCSNQITTIENLQTLKNLEILWLCDNKINVFSTIHSV
eukprot:TRINITY_DN20772_c0_g1_i1.p1 TRINITY_DN20772_c0_g1~~TRINITY_DN20772_c0_g1_i1.p1  ORF type:complete len:165 (-),score=50.63 TRINITY_DN20772_c0_g1_i1:211-705(-)